MLNPMFFKWAIDSLTEKWTNIWNNPAWRGLVGFFGNFWRLRCSQYFG
jgi:hypothetical protein